MRGSWHLMERLDRKLYGGLMRELEDIVPADLPGLRGITWNRDPNRPIPPAEAFAIYERNWRHVDEATLSENERRLVAALTERFGRGVPLR